MFKALESNEGAGMSGAPNSSRNRIDPNQSQ